MEEVVLLLQEGILVVLEGIPVLDQLGDTLVEDILVLDIPAVLEGIHLVEHLKKNKTKP